MNSAPHPLLRLTSCSGPVGANKHERCGTAPFLRSDGSSPPSLGRFPRISLSNHWYYRAARGGERLPTFCLSSSQLAKGSPTRSRSPLAAYLGSASAPPPSPGHGR